MKYRIINFFKKRIKYFIEPKYYKYLTNATQLHYIENMYVSKQVAEKICEERGLRKTRTRISLLAILQESGQPLAIPEILKLFRKQGCEINKTTLYREVENLCALEVLRAVHISPRKVSYELANHEHHHHFVCTNCDFVADVQFPEESIQKTERLLREQGVEITHHALEFFGLCKTCN